MAFVKQEEASGTIRRISQQWTKEIHVRFQSEELPIQGLILHARGIAILHRDNLAFSDAMVLSDRSLYMRLHACFPSIVPVHQCDMY